MMRRIHTLIVGGGQAGLALSRCLSDAGVEHVVLERGRVAERWRSERWDSLRLLTPNWQSRLPGYHYTGPDPDGYMTMPEVVAYLEGYANQCGSVLETGTTVSRVARTDDGYRVDTDGGAWLAEHVVIATGYCDRPFVPAPARRLSEDLVQIVPGRYRNPDQLPRGGVLVVGASASGIQIADELAEAGRPVTLAVGRHIRLPRQYRGRDILWWLDTMGSFSETTEDVADLRASRGQASLQLVGRPDHRTLDLGTLQDHGVRVVGRLLDAEGDRVTFDDDLVGTSAAADVKLASLLTRIEQFRERGGGAGEAFGEPEPFVPLWPRFASRPAPGALDLRLERITTVVWATGFRRSYPWLKVPALDARGEIRHRGGITDAPGLYVLGLQFQRRRNSAFIDGVGRDAFELAAHIVGPRAARTSLVDRRTGPVDVARRAALAAR